MPKDDTDDMTPAQARKIIEAHEKKHGRDMTDKITPTDEKRGVGRHDVPTQAELDEEPAWHKQGKKFSDLPDDQ
jgi:hypothetical protein